MSKDVTPKPKTFAQPEGVFPTTEEEFAVRFVYVPGTGLFAGDGKKFYPSNVDSPLCWRILRQSPRLSEFLTKHPLLLVTGVVKDQLEIVSLHSGGSKWDDTLARAEARTLPWRQIEVKKVAPATTPPGK
jgi:hypothetical protein